MRAASEARRGWGWRALTFVDGWANRVYGSRYNPLYQSGAIVVALLGVLLATGVYLLLFYRLGAPWASVARITAQSWSGRWIRGVHRFASDAAVVMVAVHAFRMYAQRRSWGPRALAWLTGVALLGLFLVCGWTGYVMVWDVHGQVLAAEGARFLDLVPIFSEPIGRTFVGEEPLPSAFFFLNLFAHVALPVGLGLVVWIHVARVARPVLLPPRPLLWGVVGALVLLAVVWPVGIAPAADLFRIPDQVPLDLFFSFWLPLTRGVPAWEVWLVGGALILAVVLMPVWTRPSTGARPTRSEVDERRCTGCEQCVLDCPYDAIAMVPRSDGREGLVARVNQDVCVSCGICIGSCAPMAVGPVGRTGRDQRAAARAFWEREKPGAAGIVVVGCEWSAAGLGGALSRSPVRTSLFPVACAGNIHTSVLEYLIRNGAGGVLVVSCPEQDCRGREGGKWLRERVAHGREAELQARVDRRRLRLIEASAGEPARLAGALAELAAAVGAAEERPALMTLKRRAR